MVNSAALHLSAPYRLYNRRIPIRECVFGFQMFLLNGREGPECKYLRLATKWHLQTTTGSDIQQPGGVQRLVACRWVSARTQPTWMINKAAVTERTLIPLTRSGLPVPRRDAVVTATVTGGASDLCLTNGCFIIPSKPVFIALYFKLNPQRCPSIMVARDLYWGWWLGPRDGGVRLLNRPPHQRRQVGQTMLRLSVSCHKCRIFELPVQQITK